MFSCMLKYMLFRFVLETPLLWEIRSPSVFKSAEEFYFATMAVLDDWPPENVSRYRHWQLFACTKTHCLDRLFTPA